MRELRREHFGRGESRLTDIRMTHTQIRRENPRPEFLHVAMSPEFYWGLRRESLEESYRWEIELDKVFGLTAYVDLGLPADGPGYEIAYLR